ncbi:MAG: hypothetical protein A3E94_00855 [Candidatus Zambryskibacteria bacterium RIFCSPHIGHO2_12_FULL_44_12b]|uniref:DUF4352 domain-containing protein n=1 Tax=Candidatus Zambryskibacteria bacterium RIFCSPLOWO2_01_FULL_45_21 TaxID=1802761 RepID=A0A1G2U5D0_9BACT|nr:MAG: hypothetical protein A3E94_00855 [Candidatus Zambryskibacteria bacterium RIFCSPHIGHO2_12_FULL_44_12b]OHB04697.1 MAG: hypothetical protein A3B14_01655 [Candidatus Zambryskibacteria bacterium RIFCSPLOWO2_01_FULL_45_21]
MNKAAIIPILTLVLIGVFIVLYSSKPVSSPAKNSLSTEETQAKWESKTDEQENVTVTVTPVAIDFSSQTTEWKFDIVLNTHSVELNQDLTEVATIVDDAGKEYKPLRWEGAEAGGHHREGMLVFAPINPYPRYLKLIIKSVGDVERLFSWTLFE